MWLGASASGQGFVLRAQGFNPEVISTYPVQFIIGGYEEIGDAYADTYNMDGHTFYVLGFPKADATWVYDLEMQLWHERGTWAVGAVDYSIWRPRCHAFAFGEHRWLDITDGAVYRMAQGLWTDASGFSTLPIRRLRRAPAIESENDRVFYGSFELDIELGDGLENGQGSDPQVMLRISRNGGATFGSERWRSGGKHGDRKRRIMWDRIGMARRLVLEIVVSDPIPWKVTGGYLSKPEGEEGAA